MTRLWSRGSSLRITDRHIIPALTQPPRLASHYSSRTSACTAVRADALRRHYDTPDILVSRTCLALASETMVLCGPGSSLTSPAASHHAPLAHKAWTRRWVRERGLVSVMHLPQSASVPSVMADARRHWLWGHAMDDRIASILNGIAVEDIQRSQAALGSNVNAIGTDITEITTPHAEERTVAIAVAGLAGGGSIERREDVDCRRGGQPRLEEHRTRNRRDRLRGGLFGMSGTLGCACPLLSGLKIGAPAETLARGPLSDCPPFSLTNCEK